MKKCQNCSEEISKDFEDGDLCEECAQEADMAEGLLKDDDFETDE